MKPIHAALIGVTLTLAGAADAQSVNERQARQQQRIENGVNSGRMTPGEAARAERQQGRIARTEDRMRDRNGGHLSFGQRARLEARQDHASANIYRKKHNRRGY